MKTTVDGSFNFKYVNDITHLKALKPSDRHK